MRREHGIGNRLLGGLVVMVLALAGGVGVSGASVIEVSTTGSGPGSLPDAFVQANANPGPDTVVLQAGVEYVICGGLASTEGPLTLVGNGSTIRQGCAGSDVLFNDSGALLTIQDVTVTGVHGCGSSAVESWDGPLVIEDSRIIDNESIFDLHRGGVEMWNDDHLSISGSVVSGNDNGVIALTADIADSTIADNRGDGVQLGGLYRIVGCPIIEGPSASELSRPSAFYDGRPWDPSSITSSTISGNAGVGVTMLGMHAEIENSTITGNGSVGPTGGISASEAELELRQVTLSDNEGVESANLRVEDLDLPYPPFGPSATIFGTVVTSPAGGSPDCVGSEFVSSLGYNYETGSDSCGFNGPGDTVAGSDAGLGPLSDNGGPTLTRRPADASPLVDAVPPDHPYCLAADQRHVPRPAGPGCDIGAVEIGIDVPITTTAPTSSTPAPSPASSGEVTATPTASPTTGRAPAFTG